MLDKFKKAKLAGTPFIVVKTADPVASLQKLTKVYTDAKEFSKEDAAEIKKIQASYRAPVVAWDVASGVYGVNAAGRDVAAKLGGAEATLMDVLKNATQLPGG